MSVTNCCLGDPKDLDRINVAMITFIRGIFDSSLAEATTPPRQILRLSQGKCTRILTPSIALHYLFNRNVMMMRQTQVVAEHRMHKTPVSTIQWHFSQSKLFATQKQHYLSNRRFNLQSNRFPRVVLALRP